MARTRGWAAIRLQRRVQRGQGSRNIAKLTADMDMDAGNVKVRIVTLARQNVAYDISGQAEFRGAVSGGHMGMRVGRDLRVETQRYLHCADAQICRGIVDIAQLGEVFDIEPADVARNGEGNLGGGFCRRPRIRYAARPRPLSSSGRFPRALTQSKPAPAALNARKIARLPLALTL